VQTLIANPASMLRDSVEIVEWRLNQEQDRRLANIEFLLNQLLVRETVKAHYSVEEFSTLVGKAEFTVRQWCNLGRINAEKSMTQSGSTTRWVISRAEYERYSREGLMPLQKPVR
jgi:hypothetical protein